MENVVFIDGVIAIIFIVFAILTRDKKPQEKS